MRLNKHLLRSHFLYRSLLLAVAGLLCGVLALHLERTTNAQQPAATNNSNGSTKTRAKRLTPLRSSDTADGSRVTITSDGELNDYSAYRSGDRFIVVVPQAEGSGGGVKGRGFEGAQVEKRGKDLVYTFKLQPGATARVNQRFNRLDVQFSAAKDAKASNAGNSNPATNANSSRTKTSEDAGPKNTTPTPQPTPDARRPTPDNVNTANNPAANNGTTNNGIPNNGAPNNGTANAAPPFGTQSPDATTLPPGSIVPGAVPSPTVAPAAAPPADQIAQAQEGTTPAAPVSITSSGAPAAATTSTLGAVIVRNWPWLIAALLALGIGLLFVSRSSERRQAATLPTLPPPSSPRRETPVVRVTKTAELNSADASTAINASTASNSSTASTSDAASLATTAATIASAATAASLATSEKASNEKQSKKKKKKRGGNVKGATGAQEINASGEASTDSGSSSTTRGSGGAVIAATGASLLGAASDAKSAQTDESAQRESVESKEIEPVFVPTKINEARSGEAQVNESGIAEPAAVVAFESERIEAEIKKLLAGESYDVSVVNSTDAGARQLIASELMSAVAGRHAGRGELARTAFRTHGYFDEAARDLQSAVAPAERASAARTLGLVGDTAATPHLIAALEDPSAEVRRTSVEALGELRDPAAVGALETLRYRETSRQVPRALIQRAIESCKSAVEDDAALNLEAAAPTPLVAEREAVAPAQSATKKVGSKEIELSELQAIPRVEQLPTGGTKATLETASAATPEAAREDASAEITQEAAPAAHVSVSEVSAPFVAPPPVEDATLAPTEAADELADRTLETPAPFALVAETLPAAGEVTTEMRRGGEPQPDDEESQPVYGSDVAVGSAESPSAGEDEWIELDVEEHGLTAPPGEFEPAAESGIEAPDSYFAVESGEQQSPLETNEPFASIVAPVLESHVHEPVTLGETPEVEAFESNAVQSAPVETSRNTDSLEASFADSKPIAAIAPFVSESWSVVAEEPRAAAESVRADKELEVAGEAGAESYSIIPKGIQVRLGSEEAGERAESVLALSRLNTDEAFGEICAAFDDPSVEVRNAAARALYDLSEDRADSFTRALRESPVERRRQIGSALAGSGLAEEAIGNLTGESRDKTYDAFSLLFLMAKAGEVAPLLQAIEAHPDNEVRLAVVKLLALSGQHDILPSFRRLAVRGSLPAEVRSAVMEAIYQISSTPAAPTAQ